MAMITILIILYIIGFFFTYWISKKVRNLCDSNELIDIFGSMYCAIINPIAIIPLLIVFLVIKIDMYLDKHKIKIPKWL